MIVRIVLCGFSSTLSLTHCGRLFFVIRPAGSNTRIDSYQPPKEAVNKLIVVFKNRILAMIVEIALITDILKARKMKITLKFILYNHLKISTVETQQQGTSGLELKIFIWPSCLSVKKATVKRNSKNNKTRNYAHVGSVLVQNMLNYLTGCKTHNKQGSQHRTQSRSTRSRH